MTAFRATQKTRTPIFRFCPLGPPQGIQRAFDGSAQLRVSRPSRHGAPPTIKPGSPEQNGKQLTRLIGVCSKQIRKIFLFPLDDERGCITYLVHGVTGTLRKIPPLMPAIWCRGATARISLRNSNCARVWDTRYAVTRPNRKLLPQIMVCVRNYES